MNKKLMVTKTIRDILGANKLKEVEKSAKENMKDKQSMEIVLNTKDNEQKQFLILDNSNHYIIIML